MTEDQSLIDVVSLIYKNRKKIIIASLLAGLVSAAISLLLPNYFKSTTVFYPASSDLAKPMLVGNEQINRNYYGDGKDIDRLLSIAHSTQMANYLINNFNLYEHYDIDSTNKRGPAQMMTKLFKLYKPIKSKYDAIELSVEDVDKNLAANMANSAREKISDFSQNVIKESQKRLLTNYEDNINEQEKELTLISDSLNKTMAKYEIYDATSQGKTFGEMLPNAENKVFKSQSKLDSWLKNGGAQDSIIKMKSELAGFKSQYENLKTRIKLFNDGYTSVLYLAKEQDMIAKQLTIDKAKHALLQSTYDSPFASIHLVQKAEVSQIKSRPKRSLIVIGITLITGILSVLYILLLNQFKVQGWREKILN